MHYLTAYPSDYLNASDVPAPVLARIARKPEIRAVPTPPLGEKKQKLCITFDTVAKPWPVPKKCARLLADAFGNETDAWLGKAVHLFCEPDKTPQGMRDCVRIKIPSEQPAAVVSPPSNTEPEHTDPKLWLLAKFDSIIPAAKQAAAIAWLTQRGWINGGDMTTLSKERAETIIKMPAQFLEKLN